MGLVNRVIARKTTQSDWQESVRFVADGDALRAGIDFTRTDDTYEANGVGVMPDQDGVTPEVGNRFVLDFAVADIDTGILEVVDIGSGGTTFKWKRAAGLTSAIDASKPAGLSVRVEEGDNFGGKIVKIVTIGDIEINVDPLDFDLDLGAGTALTGWQWTFDAATADADPGAGKFRLDNATQEDATQLFISELSVLGVESGDILNSLDLGAFIYAQQVGDPSRWKIWEVASLSVPAGVYSKIQIDQEGSGGDLEDGAEVEVIIFTAGNEGVGTVPTHINNENVLRVPVDRSMLIAGRMEATDGRMVAEGRIMPVQERQNNAVHLIHPRETRKVYPGETLHAPGLEIRPGGILDVLPGGVLDTTPRVPSGQTILDQLGEVLEPDNLIFGGTSPAVGVDPPGARSKLDVYATAQLYTQAETDAALSALEASLEFKFDPTLRTSGSFSAVAGNIYRYDGTGTITANLPTSPADGDIVGFVEAGGASFPGGALTVSAIPNTMHTARGTNDSTVALRGLGVYTAFKWDATSAKWRMLSGTLETQLGSSPHNMLRTDLNGAHSSLILAANAMVGRNGTDDIGQMAPHNVLSNLYVNGLRLAGFPGSGNHTDYNGGGTDQNWDRCWLHVPSTGGVTTISGIRFGTNNDFVPVKVFVNETANDIKFINAGTATAGAHAIRTPNGLDYVLHTGSSVLLVHDASSSRWLLVSGTNSDKYRFTPVNLTTNQNNWAVAGADINVVRINCTVASDVTGIDRSPFAIETNGFEMRRLKLLNVGSANTSLLHESASSAEENRMICPSAATFVLAPGAAVDLLYDPTSTRWRVDV